MKVSASSLLVVWPVLLQGSFQPGVRADVGVVPSDNDESHRLGNVESFAGNEPKGSSTSPGVEPETVLEKYGKSVNAMTIQERADAADYFSGQFKKAYHEITKIDTTMSPELQELIEASLPKLEALHRAISDTTHFVRRISDSSQDALNDSSASSLDREQGVSDFEEVLRKETARRRLGSSRKNLENGPAPHKEAEMFEGFHRITQEDDAFSILNAAAKTPSHQDRKRREQKRRDKEDRFGYEEFARSDWKYVQSLKARFPFRNQDSPRNGFRRAQSDEWSPQSRRRLKTKEEKCLQLAECASSMSVYDIFAWFLSDDIDPGTGEVDENLIRFDEIDILPTFDRIKAMAQDILAGNLGTNCNNLLEEFHRTVEFEDIPQWEGATISQVCLAQGTQVFLDVTSAALAGLPTLSELIAMLHDQVREFFVRAGGVYSNIFPSNTPTLRDNTINAVNDFVGDYARGPLGDRMQTLINKFAQETFQCAKDLFDSGDRVNDPKFAQEEFIFAPGPETFVFSYPDTDASFAYRIPTGVNTAAGSRTAHGQIKGNGIDYFTFTDTRALLQEYESCVSGSTSLFVPNMNNVITELHAIWYQGVTTSASQSGRFNRAPEGHSLNVSQVHEVLDKYGLAGGDLEDYFCHASHAFFDGTCCGACGGTCGRTNCAQRGPADQCCPNTVAASGRVCGTPEETACTVDEKYQYYNIMLEAAATVYSDTFRECVTDFFDAIQTGLGLVFGEQTSQGFICGIKSAVVDEGKSLPGECCLDAPYELDGDNWGFKYECSMTCNNLAPYFGGISEESCATYGGTWCAKPTDCSRLQSCIEDLWEAATADPMKQAFAMYLSAAPNITDPMDYDQCAATRMYFGFDPDFINDAQICDDVEQLRFSRDFAFLDGFFNQGTDLQPEPPGPPGEPVEPEPPEDPEEVDPDPVPPLELSPPDRTASESTPVQNGLAWRSTNFVLSQGLALLEVVIDQLDALDACPLIGYAIPKTGLVKFPAHDKCNKAKAKVITAKIAAFHAAEQIFAISEFTYGEAAETNNVMAFELFESIAVVFENMEQTGVYLQERFMELSDYINAEIEFLDTRLSNEASFLDQRIQNENAHIDNRIQDIINLVGRRMLAVGEEAEESLLPGADDHHHRLKIPSKKADCNESDLHRVEVEILSSQGPKSFVCNLVRHKDAGLTPKLMGLQVLDPKTERKVPVTTFDAVSLGDGALLVKISKTNVVDSNMFFATIGVMDPSDHIVAEHSLIVAFPHRQQCADK